MTTEPGPNARGIGPGGRVLLAILGVLWRLPEPPLVAAAEAIGEIWYRLARDRRAQARANLGRVCAALASSGRGGPRVRRAATDPDALERMVRATFRHAVRYYLEVARAGGYTLDEAVARIDVITPAEVSEMLGTGRPIVLVGMHYGAIELPAIEVVHLLGRPVTAPMELVENPTLRDWFLRSRRRTGVDIVPLAGARRALLDAIHDGRSVGLVADRNIAGRGITVPFFGHPASLPAGPALIALESGSPVFVGSAQRTTGGRYRGRLIRVRYADQGTHRERMVALTSAIASAFEAILADGPEQWWGAFHPIWPDLVVGAARADAATDHSRSAHVDGSER